MTIFRFFLRKGPKISKIFSRHSPKNFLATPRHGYLKIFRIFLPSTLQLYTSLFHFPLSAIFYCKHHLTTRMNHCVWFSAHNLFINSSGRWAHLDQNQQNRSKMDRDDCPQLIRVVVHICWTLLGESEFLASPIRSLWKLCSTHNSVKMPTHKNTNLASKDSAPNWP